MAFKARKVKHGFFEVEGLETFVKQEIERLGGEIRKALGMVSAKAKKVVAPKAPARTAKKPLNVLDQLQRALEASPRKAELLKAGKQKDQLLRSLIPLYLGKSFNAEISSGVTSKFWAKHGVKFAAPNAAKALREHVGYARRTKSGTQITPNGVQYVEAAMSAKHKAA